jgi:hypothetical protein
MKKIFPALAAACLLLLVVLIPVAFGQATPTPTPPSAPSILRGHNPSALRTAIASLEKARAELQASAQDYGGHRGDAVAACDMALVQLRLALQYENPPGTPEASP